MVRTGAVEVRKVRGEINPVDLFITFLPSKGKVHSLVRLLGCEYRAGRSAAAPLLRPMEEAAPVSSVDLGLPGGVLPHLRPKKEIEELYPRFETPEVFMDRDFEPTIPFNMRPLGDARVSPRWHL